jgi:hypothetical protein
MTVRNLTGFTGACQEAAVIAVLDAIANVGEERRGHLTDAKLAVDKASHDAHSGENGISPITCAVESESGGQGAARCLESRRRGDDR